MGSVPLRRSIHGAGLAGFTDDDEFVVKDGFVAGGVDAKTAVKYPDASTMAFFEDFLGQALDTGGMWGTITGTDTGGDNAYGIVSGAAGGILSLKANNNAGLATAGATGTQALIQGRHFHANLNDFRLAGRVRSIDTGTAPTVAIFFGLSDDTGTNEFPIFVDTGTKAAASTSGDITAVAANAFGFLYDSATDTGLGYTAGRWHGVSAAGGTVTAAAPPPEHDTGFINNKWYEVEMHYHRGGNDTGGTVDFYINGLPLGSIHSPTVLAATLTPWIGIHPKKTDTGSSEMQMDWIAGSAARDSGD